MNQSSATLFYGFLAAKAKGTGKPMPLAFIEGCMFLPTNPPQAAECRAVSEIGGRDPD